MLIAVRRTRRSGAATLGVLHVNGWRCFTLEDQVRPPGVKVPGKTAIPAGRYRVLITESARFRKPLPLLLDVPHFSGIRIHAGNTEADTEGCILVGKRLAGGRVLDSRTAMAELQPRLQQALDAGEVVEIEVRNAFEEVPG